MNTIQPPSGVAWYPPRPIPVHVYAEQISEEQLAESRRQQEIRCIEADWERRYWRQLGLHIDVYV